MPPHAIIQPSTDRAARSIGWTPTATVRAGPQWEAPPLTVRGAGVIDRAEFRALFSIGTDASTIAPPPKAKPRSALRSFSQRFSFKKKQRTVQVTRVVDNSRVARESVRGNPLHGANVSDGDVQPGIACDPVQVEERVDDIRQEHSGFHAKIGEDDKGVGAVVINKAPATVL